MAPPVSNATSTTAVSPDTAVSTFEPSLFIRSTEAEPRQNGKPVSCPT